MAYAEDHAELLRADLFDEPGIAEKKMFGGSLFYEERPHGLRGTQRRRHGACWKNRRA